jgi:hypothetical protein
MAQMDADDVAGVEIEKVAKKVAKLFDDDSLFYGMIAKSADAQMISGRDMRIPLQFAAGTTFSYVNLDGGSLGRGTGPNFDKAVINVKDISQNGQWTFRSEYETDSGNKAVVKAAQRLISAVSMELKRALNGQVVGNGNGVFGKVNGSPSSTGSGNDKVSTCVLDPNHGAKLLRKNNYVKVYSSDRSTDRASSAKLLVTYLDLPTKTIKITGNVSIQDNDVIMAAGLSGATPTAINGVLYYHDSASTGTMLGLSRANYPEIRANKVDSGGSFAVRHARLAINRVGDRVGMENGYKMQAWMNPAQVSVYEQQALNVSQIMKQSSGSQSVDLAFSQMQIAGVPIKKDFSWDKTRIDFIIPAVWKKVQLMSPHFVKVGGSKILPVYNTSGEIVASKEIKLLATCNLYSERPDAGSYVSGLTIPSGYN